MVSLLPRVVLPVRLHRAAAGAPGAGLARLVGRAQPRRKVAAGI